MSEQIQVTPQEKFLEKIKEGIIVYRNKAVPIEFLPPRWNGKDPPNAEIYYMKPVYLCAPHLNFPGVAIPCAREGCSGVYTEKGWANGRDLYGLATHVVLLQYRYHCNDKNCPQFRSSICTDTIIQSPRCPKFIRQQYENLYQLTEKAGVTGELNSYILNDAMTSKGFEDIQKGIETLHRERYLANRASYISAIQWYCHISNRAPNTFPEFSAIDDRSGYNSNMPGHHFILDLFLGKSTLLSDYMADIFTT